MKILRLQEGDSFLMGIINGFTGRAVITGMDSESLTIAWKPETPPVPLFPVTLLVAQVRPICMKRILREAVSFGVGKIAVTGTDTGERSYRDARLWKDGKYTENILSGAQQAGETAVPEVELFSSLDTALAGMGHRDTGTMCIVLDNVDPDSRLSTMHIPSGGNYILAVGPERGWSDRERELLAQTGFISAGLGVRTLRTETACSAGLSLLLGRLCWI